MDHLENLHTFVAVAEAQGLASAARRLGRSPPAVTRAIAALEQRIGTRLLQRTTRSVRLTEAGERFLADCRRILAELAEAEVAAAGAAAAPAGQLALTAPILFGHLHLAPVVLSFLEAHPGVGVHTFFVDRVVNLVEEGYDVALRIARLPDSGLTAVRVGAVRRVVVASPDFLARHGEPRTAAELAHLPAIGFSQTAGPGLPWVFRPLPRSGTAAREAVHPPTRLVANTGEMALAAARAGHGCTRALSYQVADDVHAGRLRIVLADREAPPVPVHLVYPAGRQAPAKVRAFIDLAVQRLRGHPALAG